MQRFFAQYFLFQSGDIFFVHDSIEFYYWSFCSNVTTSHTIDPSHNAPNFWKQFSIFQFSYNMEHILKRSGLPVQLIIRLAVELIDRPEMRVVQRGRLRGKLVIRTISPKCQIGC